MPVAGLGGQEAELEPLLDVVSPHAGTNIKMRAAGLAKVVMERRQDGKGVDVAELSRADVSVELIGSDGNGFVMSPLSKTCQAKAPPTLGRLFLPEDGGAGNPRVILVGHSLWVSLFGANPDLIGEQLTLDEEDYEVVGIMPPGFRFPPFWATEAEMWVPLTFSAEEISNRGSQYLRVFARLAPDTSLERARAEIATLAYRQQEAHPETNTG